MNKRIISCIYKLLVVMCLAIGITVNVLNTISVKALLSYFTMQSNIICLVAFIIFIVLDFIKKDYKNGDGYYIIKGAITIAILVTGIVYNIALSPMNFKMDFQTSTEISTLLVHLFSPILVFLDYLLFDKKGNFKLCYPIFWLVIPLNYIIYVYLYSSLGGKFFGIGGSREFAYFFLDYNKIGYIGVLKWMVVFIFGILMLSYILICIDYKMARRVSF